MEKVTGKVVKEERRVRKVPRVIGREEKAVRKAILPEKEPVEPRPRAHPAEAKQATKEEKVLTSSMASRVRINRSKATAAGAVGGATKGQLATARPISTVKPYHRKMQPKAVKALAVEKELTSSREQMEQRQPTLTRKTGLQTMVRWRSSIR